MLHNLDSRRIFKDFIRDAVKLKIKEIFTEIRI